MERLGQTTSPSLWRLALRADEAFAVIGDDGSVSRARIFQHAAELADVLKGAGETDRWALTAVATSSPVATVVAVLALSSVRRPAAIVGSPRTAGAMEALRNLSPVVVVHDTETQRVAIPTGATIDVRLDGRTGAVSARSGTRTTQEQTHAGMANDGDPAQWPFLAFRTSGTSGAAKWVVHSEASLWASLDSKVRGMARYDRDEGLSHKARAIVTSVVRAPRAVFIPLATISGYTQFVHCLALGVPLVATAEMLPRKALGLTAHSGAGTLVVTPSILRLMMALPDARGADWSRLGVIGLGGGRLHPDLFAAAEETFEALVVQGYGSTELGGAVTNVRIYDDAETRAHTVGRPLGGVEIKVRRPDGSPAATGEAGEVMVRAPDRLALGYLDPGIEPRITPLCLRDGFYSTGDVGAVDADRNLVILGRTGGQISRGDENFTPEEVEAVLEAHPQVVSAVVIAEDRPGTVRVQATCTVSAGRKLTVAEIREWCRQRLSRTRCPDIVELVEVGCTEMGSTPRASRSGHLPGQEARHSG